MLILALAVPVVSASPATLTPLQSELLNTLTGQTVEPGAPLTASITIKSKSQTPFHATALLVSKQGKPSECDSVLISYGHSQEKRPCPQGEETDLEPLISALILRAWSLKTTVHVSIYTTGMAWTMAAGGMQPVDNDCATVEYWQDFGGHDSGRTARICGKDATVAWVSP
jgi:hypothetical protein